jgi:hypothetical protein
MVNKINKTNIKGEIRKVYKILAGKPEQETALETRLYHCQN